MEFKNIKAKWYLFTMRFETNYMSCLKNAIDSRCKKLEDYLKKIDDDLPIEEKMQILKKAHYLRSEIVVAQKHMHKVVEKYQKKLDEKYKKFFLG